MTCIAGCETKQGQVWLAGESELADENERSMLSRPKVWVRDGLVWGMSGASRPADLIRYSMRTPKLPRSRTSESTARYVIVELVDAVSAIHTADGVDDLSEWAALVGVRGELWMLDSDGLQAERMAEGYSAIGCGSTAALVGMAATVGLSPRVRLNRVVAAVCRHVPGCGGKITVVHG